MITHALARNTIIPCFMVLFILHKFTKHDFQKIYASLIWFTIILFPTYLILVLCGFKPVSWFLSPTWTTNYSILQYLFYIPLVSIITYNKSRDYSLSFTVSIISATTVGYLYEIPYWIRMGGLIKILRTSKNSLIYFDFGMVAFFYFVFLVVFYRIRINKRFFFGLGLYLVYVVFYCLYFPGPFMDLYLLTNIPPAFTIRIPSMIFMYIVSTNIIIPRSQNKCDRLYYFGKT